MLTLANVSKAFFPLQHRIPVLQEISATFQPGQMDAITGPSGAGKSTLLALLAGLDTPTAGEVTWRNKPVTSMTRTQATGFLLHECALIFQYPYLIGELSVLENCMLKGLAAGMPLQECKKRAHELLTLLGLQGSKSAMPLTLSGGEQQRVAVARALLLRPTLVIADEPTAHLDEQNKKIIIDSLAECAHADGAVVIVSSHDDYVRSRADQVFTLANGSLQEWSRNTQEPLIPRAKGANTKNLRAFNRMLRQAQHERFLGKVPSSRSSSTKHISAPAHPEPVEGCSGQMTLADKLDESGQDTYKSRKPQ